MFPAHMNLMELLQEFLMQSKFTRKTQFLQKIPKIEKLDLVM